MSVNITVSVPLEAIAAIKSGISNSTMRAALSATSQAVVAAVLALPYDIKPTSEDEIPQTADGNRGEKSAAFAIAQTHLDDTFTITVLHRADVKPAAVIRVHGSTKVGELALLIQDAAGVSRYSQYLVFDHKPFYDGSRGTYDEDVTLHEVGISDENAMVQLVYQL